MTGDSKDAAHGGALSPFQALRETGTAASLLGIPPTARVGRCGQRLGLSEQAGRPEFTR
ncbi:hypothetical protein DB31_3720 [Hyalangium minutum]|uniref:Uncharacterized protein n=1 Tax=Hyalangium minutum TaxID=394096 RepID=A0A085WV77_9BACT|nr:hypothetical protein DB31_3720 [Hyalangium minutum]